MGESLDDTIELNIENEQKVVEETPNELVKNDATEETISLAMKHLGLKRYQKKKKKNQIEVTIFFCLSSCRTIDNVVVGYGKEN